MPYINPQDRDKILDTNLQAGLECIVMNHIDKPGELNYAITEMIDYYLNQKGLSYTNANEVIGVLECAKMELYRRILSLYEDQKIRQNGDCYQRIQREL